MESRFITPFSITSNHYFPIKLRNPSTFSSQLPLKLPCSLSILRHPDELFPMLKLKLALTRVEKQIPVEPQHWRFCYSILNKISTTYALVTQELEPDCRDAVCVFYLLLRALDTIEDDTSIEAEVKVPMLKAFHHHIYDHHWQFSCGTMDQKILMDELHLVRAAFLELQLSQQAVIQDVTMRMGAGMAKFIHKEVATVDDYDEYCHYSAGIVGLGLLKLFHGCGKEDLPPDDLSIPVGLFLQKTNIIQDYLEDINEKPVSRMFWPREIWSKYGNKLEDFKYEENSVEAVQCLNEMVTNALEHAQDCLKCMSTLQDPAILHSTAIPLVKSIGTLALCYNNIQVFRGDVKMRLGLAAKIFDRTRTMSDVYGTFYHLCLVLKSKVDDRDPNSRKTKDYLNAIMKICLDSGTTFR